MTGPEHMECGDDFMHDAGQAQAGTSEHLSLVASAQAHYTAALAAATALQRVSYGHLPSEDRKAWIAVCGAEQRPVQVAGLPAAEGNGAR